MIKTKRGVPLVCKNWEKRPFSKYKTHANTPCNEKSRFLPLKAGSLSTYIECKGNIKLHNYQTKTLRGLWAETKNKVKLISIYVAKL